MRIFTLLCTCALALQLHAQRLDHTVVGAAGALLNASGTASLHLTVGELAVDRHDREIKLSRGFHQALSPMISAAAWEAPAVRIQLKAYPNPTVDKLTLTGDWLPGDRATVRSLLGRQLIDRELEPGHSELSLAAYPPGTYLLSIRRDGQPLATIRVIRR